jgi:hypothetical protein
VRPLSLNYPLDPSGHSPNKLGESVWGG